MSHDLLPLLSHQITASDQGDPVMNSSIVVNVVVNDLNDNPPMFVQVDYNATIEEVSKILHWAKRSQYLCMQHFYN